MFILKANNVCIELNGIEIFENGNLEIKEGEKVALIGDNGIGKTTFINALMGKIPLKKGTIQSKFQNDEIGWLLIDEAEPESVTARQFVEAVDEKLFSLKKNMALIVDHLNDEKNLEKYNQYLSDYLERNGYEWEALIEQTFKKFQLPESLWDISFNQLSGGQKTKVKLAKIMMNNPKLLILDEPTNHLDTESIQWLTEWLNSFKGSVLFISHERKFIDDVATTTVELSEKGTAKYSGGYSEYKLQKEHERKTTQALYDKQEAERKKLVETINQYKQWFSQSHNAASERDPFAKKKAAKNALRFKAKEKDLERLEERKVEKPKDLKTISALFESETFSGRHMISFEDVEFYYDKSKILFEQLNLSLNRDERLAVVGKNGSGKSTFLKLMTGLLDAKKGTVRHNPQLKIGFFMQELETLNEDSTILDEILSLPNLTETDARTILACFLFKREEVFKKISQLSMGEKCRVAFVKLYFSNANLLVLDEPTNYLDIQTRERIEDALAVYHGAVVVVSHDPYLLKKVSNRLIFIEDGRVEEYLGSYSEWEGRNSVSSEHQFLLNDQSRLELEIANLLSEEAEEKFNLDRILSLKKELEDINLKLKSI